MMLRSGRAVGDRSRELERAQQAAILAQELASTGDGDRIVEDNASTHPVPSEASEIREKDNEPQENPDSSPTGEVGIKQVMSDQVDIQDAPLDASAQDNKDNAGNRSGTPLLAYRGTWLPPLSGQAQVPREPGVGELDRIMFVSDAVLGTKSDRQARSTRKAEEAAMNENTPPGSGDEDAANELESVFDDDLASGRATFEQTQQTQMKDHISLLEKMLRHEQLARRELEERAQQERKEFQNMLRETQQALQAIQAPPAAQENMTHNQDGNVTGLPAPSAPPLQPITPFVMPPAYAPTTGQAPADAGLTNDFFLTLMQQQAQAQQNMMLQMQQQFMANMTIQRNQDPDVTAQDSATDHATHKSTLVKLPSLPGKPSLPSRAKVWADWLPRLRTYANAKSPKFGIKVVNVMLQYAEATRDARSKLLPEESESLHIDEDALDVFSKAERETHSLMVSEILSHLPEEAQKYAQQRAALERREMHLCDALLPVVSVYTPSGTTSRNAMRRAFLKSPTKDVKNKELYEYLTAWKVELDRHCITGIWSRTEDASLLVEYLDDIVKNVKSDFRFSINSFKRENRIDPNFVEFEWLQSYLNVLIANANEHYPSAGPDTNVDAIECGYCHKMNHKEEDCRKKQYDVKEKNKTNGKDKDKPPTGPKEKPPTGPKDKPPTGPKDKPPTGTGGSNKKTSELPCRAMVHEGKCSRGDECKFSHDQSVINKAKTTPCPFKDKCRFKDRCVFVHAIEADIVAESTPEPLEVDAYVLEEGIWGIIDSAAETNVSMQKVRGNGGTTTLRTLTGKKDVPVGDFVTPIGKVSGIELTEGGKNIVTMETSVKATEGFTWIPEEIDPNRIRYGAPYLYPLDGDAVKLPTKNGVVCMPDVVTQNRKEVEVNHTVLEKVSGALWPCHNCGGEDHWAAHCVRGNEDDEEQGSLDGIVPWNRMIPRSAKIIEKALKKVGLDMPKYFWSDTGSSNVPPEVNADKIVDVELDRSFNVLLLQDVPDFEQTEVYERKRGVSLRNVRLFWGDVEPRATAAETEASDSRPRVHFVDCIETNDPEIALQQWRRTMRSLVVDYQEVHANEEDQEQDGSSSEEELDKDQQERIALKHRRKRERKRICKLITDMLKKEGVTNAEVVAHESCGHSTMLAGCVRCAIGKQRRKAHKHQGLAKRRDRVWHADTAGRITPAGANGEKYFIVIIEEKTDLVGGGATRSKASKLVKDQLVDFTKEVRHVPLDLVTDQGKEFLGEVTAWLDSLNTGDEIHVHTPVPRYSPWRNGRAEKKVQDVKDMCGSSMGGKPPGLWPLCVEWCFDTLNTTSGAVAEAFGAERQAAQEKLLAPFASVVTMVREEPEKLEGIGNKAIKGFYCGVKGDCVRVGLYDAENKKVRVVLSQNVKLFRNESFFGADEQENKVTFGSEEEPITVEDDLSDRLEENLTTWAECTSCEKWRRIFNSDRDIARDNDELVCADMGFACSVPQDPAHDTSIADIDTIMIVSKKDAFCDKIYKNTGKTYAELFTPALKTELVDVFQGHGVYDLADVMEMADARKVYEMVVFVILNIIYCFKDVEQPNANLHRAKARMVGCREFDEKGEATKGINEGEVLTVHQPSHAEQRAFVCAAVGAGKEISATDVPGAYPSSKDLGPQACALLPRNAWPAEWVGKYKQPVVPLKKSVYGRFRAGFDFDVHAQAEITGIGWRDGMKTHDVTPCVYTRDPLDKKDEFPDALMRLTDDLMGATSKTDQLWKEFNDGPFPLKPKKKQDNNEKDVYHDSVPFKYNGINVVVEDIVGDPVAEKAGVKKIVFEQVMYVQQVLEVFVTEAQSKKPGFKLKEKANPMSTETEEGHYRTKDEKQAGVYADTCRTHVGGVNYLAQCTRPEIQFAVGIIARHQVTWLFSDDADLEHLFGYLKKFSNYGLTCFIATFDVSRRLVRVVVMTDASFCNASDGKGTDGYIIALIGPNTFCVVAWIAKKQTVQSLNTAETEYLAIVRGTKEAIKLCMFLEAIWGFDELKGEEVERELQSDATAAIAVVAKGTSEKLRYLRKTQRIAVSFGHEQWRGRTVTKRCGKSFEPDMLTKALPADHHQMLAQQIGMCPVVASNVQ